MLIHGCAPGADVTPRESEPADAAQLTVRQLTPSDFREWDEFVRNHPLGTPFHTLPWKQTIEEIFGYEPRYLLAGEPGSIRAVLPLFLVKRPLLGKALISSPFAVYGGVLAQSAGAAQAIRRYVQLLAEREKVQYVELRNTCPEQSIGFTAISRYVTFTQRIGGDEEAILESIPRKTRRMVRKGLSQPYTVHREDADYSVFEELYARNLRRLGTPCFPRKYFGALLTNFKGSVDIREVLLKGAPAAAVLTFYFKDRVMPYYGASDPRFSELAPNDFMYFDLMRWAGKRGYSVFDFGRSKLGSGSFAFKAHWGMQVSELPYEILLVRKKELPNYSPANPRLAPAIGLWRHVPFCVTRLVGPRLIRLVP